MGLAANSLVEASAEMKAALVAKSSERTKVVASVASSLEEALAETEAAMAAKSSEETEEAASVGMEAVESS